jgi:rod shape-determining protein MreD
MTIMAMVRLAAAFLILTFLQFSLRPLLGWRAEIDFLLIAVLLISVRVRPGAAAALGFVVGLMADSLTPDTFGAGALAMTLIAFAASWLKAGFFADNLALNGFFFFAGRWIYAIIYVLAEHQRGGAGGLTGIELAQELFVWAPLSAAVTAAAGVVLLILMRPLLEPSPA